MIGVSIAAISLALATSAASAPSAFATEAGSATLHALPSLSLPKLPLPRLHLPRLPKRSGDAEALSNVAARLKLMVSQQESWYSDHGQYRTNASGLPTRASASNAKLESVQVQILFAGRKGWTAIASHPDAPGKSCVIYVGARTSIPIIPRTRADAAEAAAEAQPVCDR